MATWLHFDIYLCILLDLLWAYNKDGAKYLLFTTRCYAVARAKCKCCVVITCSDNDQPLRILEIHIFQPDATNDSLREDITILALKNEGHVYHQRLGVAQR